MRNRKTKEEAPDKEPPKNLDYEMWTGPAPMRPYNEIVHPRGWRAFMEYGNGIVGDMCVHMLDMVRWALGLGWPTSIDSSGGILVDTKARANITDTQVATFHFDDLNVVWTHRTWGSSPDPAYPWAAIIYGDKGTLKLSVNSYDFIPQGRGEKLHGKAVVELDKFPRDAEDEKKWALELHVASAIRGHMKNFLQAIDQRSKPVADIEQGHISSASCILANLSQRLGRSLTWDPETHTVKGDDEATAQLKRPYREPWQHPAG
jgi:predicted dehydrogenase